MITGIKCGDKLKLVVGGMCVCEREEWWRIAKLVVGKVYTIKNIHTSTCCGRVQLVEDPVRFSICISHFDLVSGSLWKRLHWYIARILHASSKRKRKSYEA